MVTAILHVTLMFLPYYPLVDDEEIYRDEDLKDELVHGNDSNSTSNIYF